MKMKDVNGIEVTVDSYVKVLTLDPAEFGHLEEKDLSEVMSIIGKTLRVYDIDEYGQAGVAKERWLSENEVVSHSVGLSSDEMEIQLNRS